MQAGERSVGRLFSLLACYAFAGFVWWSALGCMPPDPGIAASAMPAGAGTAELVCFSTEVSGTTSCPTGAEGAKAAFACITAEPAQDFREWSQGCPCDPELENVPSCDGPNQCKIDVFGPVECTAWFCDVAKLSLDEIGDGEVLTEAQGACPTCTEFCDFDEVIVTLTPVPRVGWEFDAWDDEASHPDCLDGEVEMAANRTCVARFTQPEVTVSVTGSGSVTSPPLQNCRAGSPAFTCTRSAALGSTISLQALPDPGAKLLTWSGDCVGFGNSATLVMDADKACTASFTISAAGPAGGVLEIVSLADDETLLDTPELWFYDPTGLDGSSDFSIVSFPRPDGSALVRNRSLGTTREIRPPNPPDKTGAVTLSADGLATAYQDLVAFGVPGCCTSFAPELFVRGLDSDPPGPEQQISLYDPDLGIGEDGPTGGGGSLPSISGNGRFVVYQGFIPWLKGDPMSGSTYGIVLYDRCTGAPPAGATLPGPVPQATTSCTPGPIALSYDASGQPLNISSTLPPRISRDGRFVLFAGDSELLLHDRDSDDDDVYDEPGETATTSVVQNVDTQFGNVGPLHLDGSGRYVGFRSTDPTLTDATTGLPNANPPFTGRAFLRDTCAGAPPGCSQADHLLSVWADGTPIPGLPASDFIERLTDVGASGRYVALDTGDRKLFDLVGTPIDGRFGVVRDTCIGAPDLSDCLSSNRNRTISRRPNGTLLPSAPTWTRVSDDGSLALWFGRRIALVGGAANNDIPEVLLSATGFPVDLGGSPHISARSPINVPAQAASDAAARAFLVTLRGHGFVPGAQVTWNTQPRETIYVSANKLQVWLIQDDVDVAGVLGLLRVVNPGGGLSNIVSFNVVTPSSGS